MEARLGKFLKYSGMASVGVLLVGLLSGFQSKEGTLAAFFLLLMILVQGCEFSLEIQGTGSGHVTDANKVALIDCTITDGVAGGGCKDSNVILSGGNTVILVATPALGFAFDSWKNCPNPVLSTCTIDSPDDDLIITVNFSVLTASNQRFDPGHRLTCLGQVCASGFTLKDPPDLRRLQTQVH